MVRVSRNIIPSFFTIINMFFGFFAIIKASQGTPESLETAVWLVFAGGVMDAIDGKIARWAKASSDFGVEYDSLADVVTFGVAPSIIVYNAFFKGMGVIGLFLSFAPVLFGSIRLARFNTQLVGHHKFSFTGLPIPTAAITMVSFILFENAIWGELFHRKVHLFLILGISFLMISTIRYPVFPAIKLTREPRQIFVMAYMAVSIGLLFFIPEYALFVLAIIYVLYGMIGWLNGDRSSLPEEKEHKKKKSHHSKEKEA